MIPTPSWHPTGEKDADAAGLPAWPSETLGQVRSGTALVQFALRGGPGPGIARGLTVHW